MDFNLEVPQDHLYIHSVSDKGIRIGENFLNSAFILSGQQLLTDWDVTVADEIDQQSLQAIFDLQPELVLIGTGSKQVFLPPPVQALFFQQGIGFEVMTTDAACRTFNILVSEGRQVVAALLPITS
jgi:uncharacterized protein